jgi:hypothetical protein
VPVPAPIPVPVPASAPAPVPAAAAAAPPLAASPPPQTAQTGMARIAVLPIVGLEEYTAETIAWHLANEDAIHTNFNVVPVTPVIRKNILTEQSYVAVFDAGEGVHADYIMASFAKTIGYEKIFFTVVLDVHTKQQLAGDYRKYSDVQELPSFFREMTRKIMAVISRRVYNAPKLSVELMAVPAKGVNKNDAIILTQLFAIQVANTNIYNVFPRIENIDAAVTDFETRRVNAKKVNINNNDLTPADFVLSSKIAVFDAKNEILAEIIGIENDVLKKGGSINFDIIESVPDLLSRLAVQITSISR